MSENGIPADQIDTSRPHPARLYDYFLGGRDNYEVDRDAAERLLAVSPGIRGAVRANRAFLRRAVPFLVESGIRQIIDIGTGIPTSPNTHELAQAIDPEVRVAYVDNDPIVGVHANALLTGSGNTAFVPGDLRVPAAILQNPKVRSLIDFTEPVAVLLVAVLHFITDQEDPEGIVATLRDALPSGSLLVLTHGTSDFDDTREATEVYSTAAATLNLRNRARVARLFDGFELLEPGLVSVAAWRPGETLPEGAERIGVYGGVARLRR